MTQHRLGFLASAAIFLAGASAAAAQSGYQTDFTTGVSGWTFNQTPAASSVRWTIDANPGSVPGGSSRGGNSLNYNNGTDYPTPGTDNIGYAFSPVIPLTGLASPTLTFWCNFQTEPGSENASPGVSMDERWIAYLPVSGGSPIYE